MKPGVLNMEQFDPDPLWQNLIFTASLGVQDPSQLSEF